MIVLVSATCMYRTCVVVRLMRPSFKREVPGGRVLRAPTEAEAVRFDEVMSLALASVKLEPF
jgi:hypothetical protein